MNSFMNTFLYNRMNNIDYAMDPGFISIIFIIRNILLNVVADDKKGLITVLLILLLFFFFTFR